MLYVSKRRENHRSGRVYAKGAVCRVSFVVAVNSAFTRACSCEFPFNVSITCGHLSVYHGGSHQTRIIRDLRVDSCDRPRYMLLCVRTMKAQA
jgi:hypothetical protein